MLKPMELKISEIATADPRKAVFVLSLESEPTPEMATHIRRAWRETWREHECEPKLLVLSPGMTLSVLSEAEITDAGLMRL